jgi:biotin carboxyl carrier protein
MFLDGHRFHVDVARFAHTWSLLVGPAEAGPYDPDARAGLLAAPKPQGGEGGRSYEVAVVEHAAGDLTVHVNGRPVAVSSSPSGRGHQGFGARRLRTGARAEVARHGPQRVVAPMPGRIAKVLVKVGDTVAARQGLVVVEAMKMENELRSLRAGTVTQVPVVEGALVEANAVLVVID